jgi:hypothetical protein
MHLEDEALAIEDLGGRQWEEKGSRGGRWICCGNIAAVVSATTKSESKMEEIQGQDRRSAGASQQWILAGEGGLHVESHCRGSVPHGEKPGRDPDVHPFAERGLSLSASDFFKGLMGYYGIEYLNLNPNGIFHTSVFVQRRHSGGRRRNRATR